METTMTGDNLIRAILLIVLMFAFLGLVRWAWSSDRKKDFEEMEQLPLQEDPALGQDASQKE